VLRRQHHPHHRPLEGYPGMYLYHCHVLEHEANDMMRPFEVIA
jgi:hypothetical protein